MSWHHLSANWSALRGRLEQRFPHMDKSRLDQPPRDSAALTRHLAEVHDLTLGEAREELEHFFSIADLARQAPDLRAGL
ncbi:MAG: hypothetical protein N4A53_15640 [Pelagimonas sp.]|jgi:hypothetical protein|nr:hypothetical protein [Pelagimonas sp.]